MPREAQRHAVSNGSTTAATTAATSNPVESSSLDVLAVFAPKSIDWAFQFSTSTGAVVVDVCCSTSCDTGNADGAGRASSALALADAVTDAVLVDDFVVDLGLLILVDGFVVDVDTFHDVVLVDAVVDEVGVLDRTQQVMLLEGFCT